MDHVYRLAFWVLAVVALLLPSPPAHAQGNTVPKVSQTPYYAQAFGSSAELSGSYSSPAGACGATLTNGRLLYPSGAVDQTVTGNSCFIKFWGPHPQGGYNFAAQKTYSVRVGATSSMCPPSSTANTSNTCDCNTGFKPDSTNLACERADIADAAKCAAATGASNGNYRKPATSSGSTVCGGLGPNSGCAIAIKFDSSVTSNGVKTLFGVGYVTGKTCFQASLDAAAAQAAAGQTPTDQTLPPESDTGIGKNGCPKGEFPAPVLAGFTGSICIPLASASEVTSEKVSEKPAPNPLNPASAPVREITTEITTCSFGMCTTETSISATVPGAGPGGADVVVPGAGNGDVRKESKDDFCKANPVLALCKNGSFGGSCTSSFSCDGDAIQCAIAKEQHIRNCKLFEDGSSVEAQGYNTAKAVTGIQNNPDGRESVDIGASSFDTSNAFGSGSGCITDKDVTIAGHSVSIPFSQVCQYLEYLGSLNMLLAALLSMRILTRG